MKIFYVNDLRLLPNWGCRATGVALAQLISKNNEIIDSAGLETVNNSPWASYASTKIRFGGVLGKTLSDWAWGLRESSPKLSRALQKIDSLGGAKYDFITEDIDISVEEFFRIKKRIPRLEEMYESVQKADCIVINGEGTLIFRDYMLRDGLFILFIIKLGQRLGKPVFFFNAMLSHCPSGKQTDFVEKRYGPILKSCSLVVCRDMASMKIANKYVGSEKGVHLPDALFSWQERICSTVELVKANPNALITYGFDNWVDHLDLSEPYICLAGSSLRNGEAHESYATLVRKLKSLGHQVILLETCIGDRFLRKVSRETATLFLPQEFPVILGAGLLAGAACFVTGRFHPAIMASCGGTPCIFMGSNSHKNRTLQEVLDYDRVTHYSSVPSSEEIELIVQDVEVAISKGQRLREHIKSHVRSLSVAVEEYTDLVGVHMNRANSKNQ